MDSSDRCNRETCGHGVVSAGSGGNDGSVVLMIVSLMRPNIVRVIKWRRMRWAGHVARMGERRGVFRVLVGKPEGKRPLERHRHSWEDNIKLDLQDGLDLAGSG